MPEPVKDQAFQLKDIYQLHDLSCPTTERDLGNPVTVSGEALYQFINNLEETRRRQGAYEQTASGVISDDEFQWETQRAGFSEIGALLLGNNTGGQTVNSSKFNVTGYAMLQNSGENGRAIGISQFDIQKAQQAGTICGWIHSQPGNTLPSIGLNGPFDANASRLIAQTAGLPIHLALIMDRYGKKITGYIYDDRAREFHRLRGIKIKIPANMAVEKKAKLMRLQYTAS